MKNKLTPQHYCDIIVDYINVMYEFFEKTSKVSYIHFTEEDIYNYCLQRTKFFDGNDKARIDRLVKDMLEALTMAGYVTLKGRIYLINNYIPGNRYLFVFDDELLMGSLTKEEVRRLNSLDVSLSEDPVAKFYGQDDRCELGE